MKITRKFLRKLIKEQMTDVMSPGLPVPPETGITPPMTHAEDPLQRGLSGRRIVVDTAALMSMLPDRKMEELQNSFNNIASDPTHQQSWIKDIQTLFNQALYSRYAGGMEAKSMTGKAATVGTTMVTLPDLMEPGDVNNVNAHQLISALRVLWSPYDPPDRTAVFAAAKQYVGDKEESFTRSDMKMEEGLNRRALRSMILQEMRSLRKRRL